jgi:hypothetical protein
MDTTRPTTGNLLIRHATAIAIGTMTVLMLVAALSFWRQEETSTGAKSWLIHTYDVIGHLESLRSKLQDAASAERAYLLTGDAQYLEPYYDALRDTPPPSTKVALGPGVADDSSWQRRSIPQELAYIPHSSTRFRPPASDGWLTEDDLNGLEQEKLDLIRRARPSERPAVVKWPDGSRTYSPVDTENPTCQGLPRTCRKPGRQLQVTAETLAWIGKQRRI